MLVINFILYFFSYTNQHCPYIIIFNIVAIYHRFYEPPVECRCRQKKIHVLILIFQSPFTKVGQWDIKALTIIFYSLFSIIRVIFINPYTIQKSSRKRLFRMWTRNLSNKLLQQQLLRYINKCFLKKFFPFSVKMFH